MKNENLVLQYLKEMTSLIQIPTKAEFFNKFYELKEIYFEDVSPEIVGAYKQLVIHATDEFVRNQNKNIFLSAIISLSHNLIPVDDFDTELLDLFQSCLQLSDSRTKANTLIALAEYDPESPHFKSFMDSHSNRVAADAVFIEAKRSYTSAIHKKIDQFVHSQNPFFVASGVYLVSQLASYFFQNKQNDNWLKISEFFDRIEKYKKHPHEMVRKRAIQSLEVIYSLRSAS